MKAILVAALVLVVGNALSIPPQELEQLMEQHENEVLRVAVPIHQQQIGRLHRLEREYAQAGRSVEAAYVSEEIVRVEALLEKSPSVTEVESGLRCKVTLVDPYPKRTTSDREDVISIVHAAAVLSHKAGYRFDWKQSFEDTQPMSSRWVSPRIEDQPFDRAMFILLEPFRLTYKINDGEVTLAKP